MNYVPIVVATDLEVHFSVLKKGVSQYFCLYSVCTSHWCLVMSFWLKVGPGHVELPSDHHTQQIHNEFYLSIFFCVCVLLHLIILNTDPCIFI